jgi:hypothetical protein
MDEKNAFTVQLLQSDIEQSAINLNGIDDFTCFLIAFQEISIYSIPMTFNQIIAISILKLKVSKDFDVKDLMIKCTRGRNLCRQIYKEVCPNCNDFELIQFLCLVQNHRMVIISNIKLLNLIIELQK